ncbi:hypothetical protein [Mycoplasma sp. OR1901]|uniref:hypothetical protein n=1 Tax=Mycoplasma sp. OR1901 TaxID=2742195 RepID=UPI0015837315|nr:hypothetical protein [Mycoplasma sp. OR1901]QKT05248.1 hypothetical protein HTZ87_00810 [Mycoplasma sp. OR1901]
MSKNKSKTTILLSSVAAVASVATAVAILWTWSSKNNDYEQKYKILKELISKLSIEKEQFSSDFSKLEPRFKNKEQFIRLNKIKNNILDKLKESISEKEKSLSENDLNLVFDRENEYKNNENGFELNDYNKSLINAQEIKGLMTQIQDPNIKDEYLKRIVKDLKSDFKSIFSNTNATKQSLLDYLNKQNEEIQKWKKLDKDLIDQLPLALQEKFTNKLNEAGDNIFALKELNKELLEYKRLSDLADKINDVYTKGNILRDLNSSNLDELPEIEDKINKILEEESKSDFQKLKEQVIDLNSLVKDSKAHNDFEEEINVASETESIDKLLETKKKIEKYLKENAGVEGFIKFKKDSLIEKVTNSNLDEKTKNKFIDKINNAEDIQELNKLEKKIDDAIELKMNKDEARKLINLLNNPKKDELLTELDDAKNIDQVNTVANKAAKILSEQKQKAKDKLSKLDGDFETKNNFASRIAEAVKESEFIEIASQIDLYIQDLINKTQNEINKIEENPEKRADLQKRLDDAKKDPNTNAGILLGILNDARALENFEEYRKEAIAKAKKLTNKEQSDKFINDLNNAKTLDEVIKLKDQVDTAYQFQLDKEKAIEAINRVKHTVKKAEFNAELEKATTSAELVLLTSEANKYADFENANHLKYLQLKDFVEKNVNDKAKKAEFNTRLDNDLKDANNQDNISQEEVNQKLDETNKELDKFITNQKQLLEAIKERILGKLALVKDQDKSRQLENQRILLDTVDSAKELEKVVDDLLHFERTRDNILKKVDNLLDKKDYLKQLEDATNVDQLKDIETLVDADLMREAKELKDAKDNAIEKLSKVLDSNESKNDWANRVSETKDPKVVNAVIDEINQYLNTVKEQAKEALKKVVGDDEKYSDLDTKLANADSEELFKEIKTKAEEFFSNEFVNTSTSLENLSKDHPMWNQFNDEVKAAKNIQELNAAKEKIDYAILVDKHKKEAKEALKNVQDKEISKDILSRIESANDVETLVAIKNEISEQVKAEKAEIQSNVDAIKEEIKKLFTNDNIQKFNDIVANDQISLEDSRKGLEAVKEAYKIEQDQLKDAKREALIKLNKLDESPEKTSIRDQIENAQNIINDITNAKQAIKDRIKKLKDEAIAATNKLNNKEDRVTEINDAQTQVDIDRLKNLSINEFNNIKSEVEQLANNTLDIEESSTEKTNTLEQISVANSENELNKLKDHINELLTNYKQKATNEASRLKQETVNENNVLSTDITPLTSQSQVKQRIDEVSKIIEDRFSKAHEALDKLVGNDQEHDAKLAKLQELEAKKDVVTEKEITDLTSLMESIFNDEHNETDVELQKVTNPEQKAKLEEEFTNSNTIQKLKDLKKKIAVQLKKEQMLNDLPSKITFDDQLTEFRNKINDENIDSLEKLAKIEEEINQKSEYNKSLKEKTDEINAKLEKINVDNELKNSLKQELDNARTDAQAEEVRTKINQKFDQLRHDALEAIKGLEGSDEKSIQNNELNNADFESEFIKVITDAQKALQDKRNKVIALNDSTNTNEKENFSTRINEAKDIATLNQIEKEINNQDSREKIQNIINDLNASNEKDNFQTRLNNINNSSDDSEQALNTLLEEVKTKAKVEGNDFRSSLQEAKDAVALLADNNTEKDRLTAEIKKLEQAEKSKQIASEALKIRDKALEILAAKRVEIENSIKSIIEPTISASETATNQTAKFNALIAKVKTARTETDINNIFEVEAKEYLNSIREKYTNSINSLFPESPEKQQLLESINETNADNINKLNDALKEANKKLSSLIEEINKNIESSDKKEEFKNKLAEINSNNVQGENGQETVNNDRWQTRLPDLKSLYDLVKNQRTQEENELRSYKEQLEAKINSKLSGEKQQPDVANKNQKTTLLEELNAAETLEKAKEISAKLDKLIEDKRTVAKAAIELTEGHENHNHLLSEINEKEITEDKINELQRQASQFVQEARTNAQTEIDKIKDLATKSDLLEKLGNQANTVAKIKDLELQAKIINKKDELEEKLNKLWEENKSNYKDRIDALTTNNQATLDELVKIEQEIDNAQNKQDNDLEQAKQEANAVINRLKNGHEDSTEDKTNKLEKVANATNLEQIKTAKDAAQALLDADQTLANEALGKINVEDLPQTLEESNPLKAIVDLYNELQRSNTNLANEETYEDIQTRANKAFNDYKEEIRRQILENGSSKKDDLLRELEQAQTIDKLHQLANANEVYKEADKITEKLKEHADNAERTNFNNELENIVNHAQPSTDKVQDGQTVSKKQTDLNNLKDLLRRVTEAVETQNEEIEREQTRANEAINLIDGNDQDATTKKQELKQELERAIANKDVSAIKAIKDRANEYINAKRNEALTALNKLTDGKVPKATINGEKGLQDKFNDATTQTEFENIKKEVEDKLKEFKAKAEKANEKIGGELAQKLTEAIQANDQKHYDDLIDEANAKFEQYQEEARAKLREANLEDQKTYADDINNAENKEKLEEIKRKIAEQKELETAKSQARIEINKLKDPKKTELLNQLNQNDVTKEKADQLKQEAINYLEQKKQEAKIAAAKFDKTDNDPNNKYNIKYNEAVTEEDFENIKNNANNEFDNLVRNTKTNIQRLREGDSTQQKPNVADVDTKTKASEVEEMLKQALNYAKAYANKEIDKISEPKRDELKRKLEAATSVDVINDITDQAKAINDFQNAKNIARQNANTKLAGHEKLQDILRQIDEAQNDEQLTNATSQITPLLDAEANKLVAALGRLEDTNNVKVTHRDKNANNNSVEELRNAVKEVEAELKKKEDATKADIEKIHLTSNQVQGESFIQEWNRDYQNANPKGVKNRFDEIVANKYERDFKELSNRVNTLLDTKKAFVKGKIEALENSDLKERLKREVELDSNKTYNKLAEIYKEVLTGKTEEQRRQKLEEVKALIAKLKDYIPSEKRENYNEGLDSKNYAQLEEIKNRVQATLNKELQIARNNAIEEVKKLPSKVASYNRANWLNQINNSQNIDNIISIKDQAKTKNDKILSDLQAKIDEMPEQARGDLNSKKDVIINAQQHPDNDTKGDKLLALQSLAVNTVNKSRELQSLIDSSFPASGNGNLDNGGTQRYRDWLINHNYSTNKADTIEEIDQIIANTRELKAAYDADKTLYDEGIKNNVEAREAAKNDFRRALFNISTNSSVPNISNMTFDSIKSTLENLKNQMIRNRDIFNYVGEAKRIANTLLEHQKISDWNEDTLNRHKWQPNNVEIQIVKNKIEAMKALKSKLVEIDAKLKEPSNFEGATALKNTLVSQWERTNSLGQPSDNNESTTANGLYNNISNNTNGLIKMVRDIKGQINEIKTDSEKQDFITSLNQATSRSDLETLITKIERQKLIEEAEPYINRLSQNTKNTYKGQINKTQPIETVRTSLANLKTYLRTKQDDAKRSIARLNVRQDQEYLLHKGYSNNDSATEDQYSSVSRYVQPIIDEKVVRLNHIINNLDRVTQARYRVNDQIDSERSVDDKINDSNRVFEKYKEVKKLITDRFNTSNLINLYNGKVDQDNKTYDGLETIKREIDKKINDVKNRIISTNFETWQIAQNKKDDFINRWNNLKDSNTAKFEELEAFERDINAYNEINGSNKRATSGTRPEFVLESDSGISEAIVDITFAHLGEHYNNKMFYAIAKNINDDTRVVSTGRSGTRTQDDINRLGKSGLSFVFPKNKVNHVGEYKIEKVIYADSTLNDDQVKAQQENIILTSDSHDLSKYEAFKVITSSHIFPGTMAITKNRFNGLEQRHNNLDITGLKIKNLTQKDLNYDSIIITFIDNNPNEQYRLRPLNRQSTSTDIYAEIDSNNNLKFKLSTNLLFTGHSYKIKSIEFILNDKTYVYSPDQIVYPESEKIDYSDHTFINNNIVAD